MNPKYPIYIISKGRWESRLTVKELERLNVPYHIVIEPQEFDNYASVIDAKRILVLPFANLGRGSIPARNWVWEHSIAQGAQRHWILDDNLRHFFRLNHNRIIPVTSGTIFRCAEDFVDRYTNIAMAGFQYAMFAPRKNNHPPFALNTRIYSCILLNNELTCRWRGRYNEDTDLSLRVLKAGWCTVLFYAFIVAKIATMRMKGGNTDELYVEDGRLKMARSLVRQHPDVTRIVWKWGRYQHEVDYKPFKHNKLQLKSNMCLPHGPNEFGMILQKKDSGKWVTIPSSDLKINE